MKPNAKTQMDQGLGFDGAGKESTGSVRGGVHTNAWSGHMNDGRLVNKGRGPTTGNMGCGAPGQKGATVSVTRDAFRAAPTSSLPAVPKQGSVRDNINRGSQVRGSGQTTVRKPSNPDSIRAKQTGGPGYGAVSKGSRPVASTGASNFNYGPKSQY
jgi:hypothetical protein